jgi:transposase
MAHYWGRHIEAMGHEVVLIPPQHSKFPIAEA